MKEVYFKGAKTNVKHTCKSVNAAQSYTSRPLHSEFELPPDECYLSAAEKDLWKCFCVFLSSFVRSLNVSTCPKWKLMFSRLPCFVLQTSHIDKTKKIGQNVPSATIQTSILGSGRGLKLSRVVVCLGGDRQMISGCNQISVRSTFTMSAQISSVCFILWAAFVWKMSYFWSSYWSRAHS